MADDIHGEQFGVKHIREVYRKGMFEGETPDFPVSYADLREQAFERMDETAKAYVHGGAGTEETFERNKDFSAWRIVPRMLRGVADRDLTVRVRNGSNAFKALALGADSVLLGRPFAYGLAHSGQSGVENVLRNTISQLDLTMGLAGIDDVADIDRDAVKHEREL